MRLGQLSRKLGVRSADIVSYLHRNNIEIADNINSRVDGAHLELVVNHFAPGLKLTEPGKVQEESESPRAIETEQSQIQSIQEPEAELPPIETPEEPSTVEPEAELPRIIEAEGREVIKAPKVELQGLKVLGKIELPTQPQKPSQPEAAAALPEDNVERSRPRRQPRDVRAAPQKPRRNPVAVERERLEREAAERKRREMENAKKKKKHHYQNRVKQKGPTKAARLYEEPVEVANEVTPEPTSWWGKFVKWLTTY